MQRLTLLCFLFLLSACPGGSDPYLKFTPELAQGAIEQCVAENPKVSAQKCDVKQCLSNRFVLKGIDKLLQDTDEVLKDLGVRYWLEGATLLGALRFQSYIPWDDDADIDVFAKDFEPLLPEFRRRLELKGYRLVEYGGYLGISPGFWQILFTNESYRRHVLDVDPDVSLDEADRLAAEYIANDDLPHLDVFPYDCDSNLVECRVRTSISTAAIQKGLPYDAFAPAGTQPQPTLSILGKQYPVPNNIPEFLNAWFGIRDAKDVVLSSVHLGPCKTPLRFRDITKHKELLRYFKEYLTFVFGSDFKGFPSGYEP